ncbi:MAG: cytochrome c biogenesis protein [marine bacterium B5-7]|nr:MAG: cytochrome c biogenesis protein [marine bacterium B5-7]
MISIFKRSISRSRWIIALVIPALLWSTLAWSAIESREFDDPIHEARYYNLIKKLRCLVCQNQNLADSNADLARDLRNKAYDMINAGRSDAEIADFMVDRYGEFVLYDPPLDFHTLFLWGAPFLFGLIGGLVFFNLVRKRKSDRETVVSQQDLDNARNLLTRDD